MQVIATEDFPLLPKMQKKFAESAHAKVGFGLGRIVVARVAPLFTHPHPPWDPMPDSLRGLVPLFSKRQCDPALIR